MQDDFLKKCKTYPRICTFSAISDFCKQNRHIIAFSIRLKVILLLVFDQRCFVSTFLYLFLYVNVKQFFVVVKCTWSKKLCGCLVGLLHFYGLFGNNIFIPVICIVIKFISDFRRYLPHTTGSQLRNPFTEMTLFAHPFVLPPTNFSVRESSNNGLWFTDSTINHRQGLAGTTDELQSIGRVT